MSCLRYQIMTIDVLARPINVDNIYGPGQAEGRPYLITPRAMPVGLFVILYYYTIPSHEYRGISCKAGKLHISRLLSRR